MKTSKVATIAGVPVVELGDGPLSRIAERLHADAEARESTRAVRQEQRTLATALLPSVKLAQQERALAAHASMFDDARPAITRGDFWRGLKAASEKNGKDAGLRRAAAHGLKLYQASMDGVLSIGDVARFNTFYTRQYPKSKTAEAIDASLKTSGFSTLPITKLNAIAAKIDAQCEGKTSEEIEEAFVENCREAGLGGSDFQSERARSYLRGQLRLVHAQRTHSDPFEAAWSVMAASEDVFLRRAQELEMVPEDVPVEGLDTPAEHEAKEEAVPHEELTEEVVPVASPNTGDPLVVEVALADQDEVVEMGMLDEFVAPSAVVEDPSAPGENLEVTLTPTDDAVVVVGDEPPLMDEPYDVYAVEGDELADMPIQTIEASSMPVALSRLASDMRQHQLDTSQARVMGSVVAFANEAVVALSPAEALFVRRRASAPIEVLSAEAIETKVLAANTVTARDWSIGTEGVEAVVRRGEKEVKRASLDKLDSLIGFFRSAAYEVPAKKRIVLEAALPNGDVLNARRMYLAAREVLPNAVYTVAGKNLRLEAAASKDEANAVQRVLASRFGVEAQIISTAPQPTYQPPPRAPEPQTPQPPAQQPPQPSPQLAPMTQPAPQARESKSAQAEIVHDEIIKLVKSEPLFNTGVSYFENTMSDEDIRDAIEKGYWKESPAHLSVPEKVLYDFLFAEEVRVDRQLDQAYESGNKKLVEELENTQEKLKERLHQLESKTAKRAQSMDNQDAMLQAETAKTAIQTALDVFPLFADNLDEANNALMIVTNSMQDLVDSLVMAGDKMTPLADAVSAVIPSFAPIAEPGKGVDRVKKSQEAEHKLVEARDAVDAVIDALSTNSFVATVTQGSKTRDIAINASRLADALRIASKHGKVVQMRRAQIAPEELQMMIDEGGAADAPPELSGGSMEMAPLTEEERSEIESAMRTYRNQGMTIDEAVAEFRSSFKHFLQTKGEDQTSARQIVGGEIVAAAQRAWSRPALLSQVAQKRPTGWGGDGPWQPKPKPEDKPKDKKKDAAPTNMTFTIIDDLDPEEYDEDEWNEFVRDRERKEDRSRESYEDERDREEKPRDRYAQKVFDHKSVPKPPKGPKPGKVLEGGDPEASAFDVSYKRPKPSTMKPHFEPEGDLPMPTRQAPKPKKRKTLTFPQGDLPTPSKG
jgi:cell fate (sporulation/competence/biofilm development) regulator YmcA (YheA/YmcA/DUF963 family)